MNDNSGSKLDWMYKSANSLVDREEYLLGRSVDKTLEQLNAEEKEKKLGIVPPKNHVEHECIPPSIRDFNKIVQAEQVDISAKLQEDPLVAIKKREEEARRQFLQNPVQLKKLQEALKTQELKKKKKKHKHLKEDSESDLDNKIANKLKYLKGDSLGTSISNKKKKKDDALDTILMHKFNELKDRLSQEDLNDILAGNITDNEEEEENYRKSVRPKSEKVDQKQSSSKKRRRQRSISSENKLKKSTNKKRYSSNSSSSSEEVYYKKNRRKGSTYASYDEKQRKTMYKDDNKRNIKNFHRKKKTETSSEASSEEETENSTERKYQKKTSYSKNVENVVAVNNSELSNKDRDKKIVDDDLENKIMEKLRMLRNSSKSKRSASSSDSGSSNSGSDEDGSGSKPKTFGLVKADGTKIALNKKPYQTNSNNKPGKAETVTKPERKSVKRLTEDEKEQLRREMMKNAEKRDKERSENLKRYREEDKREEKSASNFDEDFVHKQLIKSTKEATVESRIKSNLNNIQRSSRHMDTHFSRR